MAFSHAFVLKRDSVRQCGVSEKHSVAKYTVEDAEIMVDHLTSGLFCVFVLERHQNNKSIL